MKLLFHPILSVLLLLSCGSAFAVLEEPVVIDLSLEFEKSTEVYNKGLGYEKLVQVARGLDRLRTFMVLEKGEIVADYVRDDLITQDNGNRDDILNNSTYPVFSVTKSWTSLIIGMLVLEDLLTVDDTFLDIWPAEHPIWKDVTKNPVQFLQNITISSMLTMSSGLLFPPLQEAIPDGNLANLGGANASHALSFPNIGVPGEFSYLAASIIMSYIIQERTVGNLSPLQFAAENIFPPLGIPSDSIQWDENSDGMQHSYHGLHLSAMHMAKFGQLYLQGGRPSNATLLVSQAWVDQSKSPLMNSGPETFDLDYGYLFWVFPAGAPFNMSSSVYCALGLGGQSICISDRLQRVFVQQMDFVMEDAVEQQMLLGLMAMSEELVFGAVVSNNKSNATNLGQAHNNTTDSDFDPGMTGPNNKSNTTNGAGPGFDPDMTENGTSLPTGATSSSSSLGIEQGLGSWLVMSVISALIL